MDKKKTELFKSIREMDFSFFTKLKERADKVSKELQFPETTLDREEAIKFMSDHYSEENLTIIVKEWKDISENLAKGVIEWDQKLKDPEISIWLEEINSCILSVSMFEMKLKTLILDIMKYYGTTDPEIFEKALKMIEVDLNKWNLYLKFK